MKVLGCFVLDFQGVRREFLSVKILKIRQKKREIFWEKFKELDYFSKFLDRKTERF